MSLAGTGVARRPARTPSRKISCLKRERLEILAGSLLRPGLFRAQVAPPEHVDEYLSTSHVSSPPAAPPRPGGCRCNRQTSPAPPWAPPSSSARSSIPGDSKHDQLQKKTGPDEDLVVDSGQPQGLQGQYQHGQAKQGPRSKRKPSTTKGPDLKGGAGTNTARQSKAPDQHGQAK